MSTVQEVEARVRELLKTEASLGTRLVCGTATVTDKEGMVVGRCLMMCVAGFREQAVGYIRAGAHVLGIAAADAGRMVDGWDGRRGVKGDPWWGLGGRLAEEFQPMQADDLRRELGVD